MNGALNSRGTAFLESANIAYQTVTILINDQNEEPEGNKIGHWWVTRDEDLNPSETNAGDSEYVEAGGWLQFRLEGEGLDGENSRPAFTDLDMGDRLTYTLVSPSWLEIDPTTGVIQNKARMVAPEGVYTVTVRATDSGMNTGEITFRLAVAVSDFNTEGATDNDSPRIDADAVDINENARAGAVVARFTVQDDEIPLGPIHPWGRLDIHVTSDVQLNGADVVAQAGGRVNPMTHYFAVHRTDNGNSGTARYEVRLTDLGAEWLDADSGGDAEVTLTIRASDGTFAGTLADVTERGDGADIDMATFDIESVNEAPEYTSDTDSSSALTGLDTSASPLKFAVKQREDGDTPTTRIYLNLSDMFEDPDDDGDITFTAMVSNAPWLTPASLHNDDADAMRTGPQRWGDIRYGADGEEGGTEANADIDWGPSTDPDPDDIVLILGVARGTGPMMSNAQDADGRIAITARDDGGASYTLNIVVEVTDENLPAAGTGARAPVTAQGSARQGGQYRVTFNEQSDPDFTGSEAGEPILVRYQWAVTSEAGTETIRQETLDPAHYTVGAGDVRGTVQAQVIYYELFNGEIVQSGTFESVASDDPVRNLPDDVSARFSFGITTNGDNELVVTPMNFTDADAAVDAEGMATAAGYTFSYEWEQSANGRGGWQVIKEGVTAIAATTGLEPDAQELDAPEAVEGMYVRLVVTYKDEGGDNRLESQEVKVGSIAHVAAGLGEGELHIDDGTGGDGANIPAGRTLRIDNLVVPDDPSPSKPGKGSVKVEWLVGARVVHTGETYTVAEGDRGMISARVTRYDEDDGVVSIVTTAARTLVAQNTPPIVAADAAKYSTIDLGAAPSKNGQLVQLTGELKLSALFHDIEDGNLSIFTVGAPTVGGFSADDAIDLPNPLDLWLDLGSDLDGSADDAEGDQILVVNERTGQVEYHTTQAQVDGDPTEGEAGGNTISMTVTGTDSGSLSATTTVMLRIDASPTGFEVGADATTDPTTAATLATGLAARLYDYYAPAITVAEHNGQEVVGGTDTMQTNAKVVARIDVQDDNSPMHAYGQYTFTVNDGRFEVVPVPPGQAGDASQGILRLKTGQNLDREAELKNGNPLTVDGAPTIVLVVTATPASGNFDPITLGITVVVSDFDDTETPSVIPDSNKVPGLEDVEDGGPDDTDGTGDSDIDGGYVPPPPGMSLGGIIEDFVDNMDAFEQDLLEDFMLVIEDGIEIA